MGTAAAGPGEIETTLGRVRVSFGYNRWVSVAVPGRGQTNRVVTRRGQLVELLVDAGVPREEAVGAAAELWRTRPKSETGYSPGQDFTGWDNPWFSTGPRSIAYFLGFAGLIALFAYVLYDMAG